MARLHVRLRIFGKFLIKCILVEVMNPDFTAQFLESISVATSESRNVLLEPEIYRLMSSAGLKTPEFYTISLNRDIRKQVQFLPSEKVVIKIVSPEILHKSDVGGVCVVGNDLEQIAEKIQSMLKTVESKIDSKLIRSIQKILVVEHISGTESFGAQLLFGMKYQTGLGHVITIGLGGTNTEELNVLIPPVIYSPSICTPEDALKIISEHFAYRKNSGLTRGGKRTVHDSAFVKLLTFFHNLATIELKFYVDDFEINPVFAVGGKLIPGDALLRFSEKTNHAKPCQTDRIHALLEPKTIAIIGISEKSQNPGRIILQNILRENFPDENIRIIHPKSEKIDCVSCVSKFSELPWKTDLLVVAVSAQQVPEILENAIENAVVKSVILIPGGIGETENGKSIHSALRALLEKNPRNRLAIVGPNCLGIRSLPGKYDTLFIPEMKLPKPEGEIADSALICQSGAFMITRMNALPFFNPKYAITTGNQMDLSVTDFVEFLLEKDDVRSFFIYLEGFDNLDGLRLAKLAGKAKRKNFFIYKAGRTAAGATATSSHTASIAGDYVSVSAALRQSGVLVTENFSEFKNLIRMDNLLDGKKFSGKKLGIISNAGYEVVGMADRIDFGFEIAKLHSETEKEVFQTLKENRIESLITIQNPLDLTPMANEVVYLNVMNAFLDDENVDALIVGLVPLTPAIKTLPKSSESLRLDDFSSKSALPFQLRQSLIRSQKPVVFVVDGGKLYDDFAEAIEKSGFPCFRDADVAIQIFQKYLDYRIS